MSVIIYVDDVIIMIRLYIDLYNYKDDIIIVFYTFVTYNL